MRSIGKRHRHRRSVVSTTVAQMLETPLSRAVHNGHLQTARHLLDKGADVNCLDIVRCVSSEPACTPECATLAQGYM